MRILILTILAVLTIPASTAAQGGGEEREVLAVVQRMFDAMRSRDTVALRSVFAPGARLVGMRPGQGGGERVQELTAEQFVRFVANDRRAEWIERMWEPEVRITGTLAAVWTAYDFHFAREFSHCGHDAFQLLKLPEGWKIVSIADTFVREGCLRRDPPA